MHANPTMEKGLIAYYSSRNKSASEVSNSVGGIRSYILSLIDISMFIKFPVDSEIAYLNLEKQAEYFDLADIRLHYCCELLMNLISRYRFGSGSSISKLYIIGFWNLKTAHMKKVSVV